MRSSSHTRTPPPPPSPLHNHNHIITRTIKVGANVVVIVVPAELALHLLVAGAFAVFSTRNACALCFRLARVIKPILLPVGKK